MSQAAQMKATPEVAPAVKMAEELFDLQYAGIDDLPEIDGDTASFRGESFTYELIEMYRDPGEVERKGEYSCTLPNAGDDGADSCVVIESIKTRDGQTMFVVFDVYQPEYYDEDWVCSGMLSLTLTTPETHDALVKEAVERARKDNESHAVSMVKGVLASVASEPHDYGRMVETLLSDLIAGATYVYERNKDEILPNGPVKAFQEIAALQEKTSRELDQAWAGAFIASLLVDHPLVETFLVEFSTSDEYDNNNYYTRKHAAITSVVFVNNVASVKLEDEGDLEVDANAYAERMQEDVDDSEWDLYDGFAGDPDGTYEFMVQVRRSDLKALLESEIVDGKAVGMQIARTLECVR